MSTENCDCSAENQQFHALFGKNGDAGIFVMQDSKSGALVTLTHDPAQEPAQIAIESKKVLHTGFTNNPIVNDTDYNFSLTNEQIIAESKTGDGPGIVLESQLPLEVTPDDTWNGFIFEVDSNDKTKLLVQSSFGLTILSNDDFKEFLDVTSDEEAEGTFQTLQSISYSFIQRPDEAVVAWDIEEGRTYIDALEVFKSSLYHCDTNPFGTIQRYNDLKNNVTKAQSELLCKSNNIIKGIGHIEAFIGMREHIRKLICMDESSIGGDLEGFRATAGLIAEQTNDWANGLGPCVNVNDDAPADLSDENNIPRGFGYTPPVKSDEIELSWSVPIVTGNKALQGYRIEYVNQNTQDQKSIPVAVNDTSVLIEGLMPNTMYAFEIFAIYDNGEEFSSSDSLTTLREGPNSLTASLVSGLPQVDLTWTEPTDKTGLTSYKVYQRESTETDFTEVAIPSTNNHTTEDLSLDTSYYFYVVAVYNDEESAQSNIETIMVTVPAA